MEYTWPSSGTNLDNVPRFITLDIAFCNNESIIPVGFLHFLVDDYVSSGRKPARFSYKLNYPSRIPIDQIISCFSQRFRVDEVINEISYEAHRQEKTEYGANADQEALQYSPHNTFELNSTHTYRATGAWCFPQWCSPCGILASPAH